MKRSICTLSIVLFTSVFGCADFADKNASSASKTSPGPALWLASKRIDLGIIPSERETIGGAIPIMNDGYEPEDKG